MIFLKLYSRSTEYTPGRTRIGALRLSSRGGIGVGGAPPCHQDVQLGASGRGGGRLSRPTAGRAVPLRGRAGTAGGALCAGCRAGRCRAAGSRGAAVAFQLENGRGWTKTSKTRVLVLRVHLCVPRTTRGWRMGGRGSHRPGSRSVLPDGFIFPGPPDVIVFKFFKTFFGK